MTNFVGGVPTVDRFYSNAARVDVSRAGGVVELVFYGPLTIPSILALGLAAAKSTEGARCLILRLDKAVMMVSSLEGLHSPETARHQTIHGAVIVSEENLELFDAYSLDSAGRGIMRAVFLSSEYAQARRWATRQARIASPAELPR